MHRFIEWDSLEIRVDGTRLNEIARSLVAAEPMIERISMRFSPGLIAIEGIVRKFIRVPFSLEITRLEVEANSVLVPLERIAAGPIPVPALLVGLVRNRFPADVIRYRDPATLVVSLDRFLPSFVATEIDRITIISGGLVVTLGKGGAELPPGGVDGSIRRGQQSA